MTNAILRSRAVRWMATVIAALFALAMTVPVVHAQTTTNGASVTTWAPTPQQLDSVHRAQNAALLAAAMNLQQLLNQSFTHKRVYRVATTTTVNHCRPTDNWLMVTARSAPFARLRSDTVFYLHDEVKLLVGDSLQLTMLCIGPGQVTLAVSDTTHLPK